MAAPRYFRHTGLALVRASTDPGGLRLPGLDLHTADGADTVGRAWLARLWDRDAVRIALRVASPALCEQITAVLSGARLERRQWRRLLVSVCSYVLRWQHRPTPFGLFAGITTATIGSTAWVKFGENHAVRIRVDPAWLDEVVSGLEHAPTVLAELSLVVNNAGFTRGDRFVVPKHLPGTHTAGTGSAEEIAGELGAVELALRCTRPVAAALALADSPVRGEELIGRLEREFSTAPREQITTMLVGLVANRVLLTNLRAPSTSTDPVAHLLDQLDTLARDARTDEHRLVPEEVAEVRDRLRVLHHEMSTKDHRLAELIQRRAASMIDPATTPPGESADGRQSSVVPSTPPRLAADVAVDGQLDLPESVFQEAETAASALLRLTRSPFGTVAWRDYHVRFRERYGAGAVVPVRELISDAGLGYPVGFLGAAREQPVPALTDRDAALHALVQKTVLDQGTEVVLSEALIDQLAVGDHTELVPPERVELAFALHTASTSALQRGRFQLWVTGAPPSASSMVGRFASLLDEHDRARLAVSYEADPDVRVAQLSFPPRRRNNEPVTRTPQLLPWSLSIAEYPAHTRDAAGAKHGEPRRCLDLDDLAVTASATRFFLIDRSSGNRVHAHVLHALETTVYTPPLARFLAELAAARSAVFGPFDYGAARTLPFLPRVRSGRSVLAPARWLLNSADLPGPRAAAEDWRDGLANWRRRWRVPANVVLCEGEQRLPLDLDVATQRSLLRTHLHRTNTVELRESGDPANHGWVGRACEFVVPLTSASRDQSEAPPRQQPPSPRPHCAENGRADTDGRPASGPMLPGASSLLLAQLEAHPQRFDDILTGHLPRLHADVQNETARLWFRRHHDTTRPDSNHYLQIFLRLASVDQYAAVTAHIAAWATELRELGLVTQLSFPTAWVQSGKYGTDIGAAEEVFAADSTTTLAELALAQGAGVPNQVVAAVSMADLATGLAGTPHDGWQWLLTVLPQHQGRIDHDLREYALNLAQRLGHPEHATTHHHTQPEAATLSAWQRRRQALTTYRTHLDLEPARVLRALLHDHAVRSVAVDPEREHTTNRLARAIALRAQALADRNKP